MRIEDAASAVWFAAFVTIVTLCFIIFLSLVDAATLTISGSVNYPALKGWACERLSETKQ